MTGVYPAVSLDGVALLDMRSGRGRWKFLDPVGAQLWCDVAAGRSPHQAVDRVTEFWTARGVDAGQVRADLSALSATLYERGLFLPGWRRPQEAAVRVRFAGRARAGVLRRLVGGVALGTALVLLRLLPIRLVVATARMAGRLPARLAGEEEAEAMFDAVQWAARCWPGRAACLEESLAAHLGLLLTGRRAHWHLGVRFTPQGAHAWITAAGSVIGQEAVDRVWPYVAALKV